MTEILRQITLACSNLWRLIGGNDKRAKTAVPPSPPRLIV